MKTATTLTVGSLFSGVGGFDLGFHRAGFTLKWMCEIDPSCRDVLCRNFPDVEVIYTNVCTVNRHMLEPVDVIIGGFPCQDLSVAGKRAGLSGERSGLFFEFARIIRELRPRFAVFENVPGLLSSNGGRDFAVVLAELGDVGALDIGWAVLDAQWFGVPQRRRRVFIVADFGGRCAAEILSLAEGLQGHPAPRREAGQGVAAGLTRGSGVGRNDPGGRREDDVNIVSAPTLRVGAESITGFHGPAVIAIRNDAYSRTGEAAAGVKRPALGVSAEGDPMYTLDASREHAIAFNQNSYAQDAQADVSGSLSVGHQIGDANLMAVRRLTPEECEKLMGYPRGWTKYGASGKEMSDSTRYRQCGNGVVTPVAEWIARRIVSAVSR